MVLLDQIKIKPNSWIKSGFTLNAWRSAQCKKMKRILAKQRDQIKLPYDLVNTLW